MASAEHEPITGVWGQSPQRGPRTEPLDRGSEAPHFGHWISNGAGKFNNCICISTLAATVIIREKIYVEIQGVR